MEVNGGGQEMDADAAGREVAKAYCGIAELYLTDLCDEEGAEENCETALKAALLNDKNNLDARQTFASMRISQQKPDEACAMIEEIYNEVYPRFKENQSMPLMSMDTEGAGDVEEKKEAPDSAFMLQTVKLMIECAPDRASLASQTLELLVLLLNENDEDPELWFVMGMERLS